MKTRTTSFDEAWADRRTRFSIYKIELKRRYWNGSAYALEASAQTLLPKRDIVKVSAITQRFDQTQNKVSLSNVSVSLANKDWKWLPTNTTTSKWAPDATATSGYDPVQSQFTIYYGLRLADETTEYISMFVGLVDDDPKFDSDSGVAVFNLIGKAEALLRATDAQNVCTTLTDQATDPATGDASRLSFSTDKMSLWQADNIRSNAVAKTQGTHYTLDNLNDAEVEATIEFTTGNAPGAGHAVLYDGKQWYRDKSISELVGLICTAAGIGSSDREIEEPIFPGIDQNTSLDTEAHWAAGSGTNQESSSLSGTLRRKWFLIDDFTDGDYTASPAWTRRDNSGGLGVASINSGKFRISVGDTDLLGGGVGLDYDTPFAESAFGTWEFKFRSNCTANGDIANARVFFIRNGIGLTADGYCICIDWNTNKWTLQKRSAGSDTVLLDMGAPDTSEHTWRITRTTDGVFTVYKDTVSQGTATDITISDCVSFGYGAAIQNSIDTARTNVTDLDDIYFSNSVDGSGAVSSSEMEWTSAEIDLLATPSDWLPLVPVVTLNGGTVTYKTRTAASSGGVYEAAVAVDAGLIPQSTKQRYFKLVLSSVKASGAYNAPEFDKVTINWRGTSLFIASADFTGMTGIDAVNELAKMGGMEYGTKGDGVFYFRNRTVAGASVLTLNHKNAIIKIDDFSLGYKDVRPIAQVRYGKSGDDGYYFSEYKASDAGEASPTTAQRFGDKAVKLDLTRFAFSNNASVADAIAQKLYTEHYRPKRRARARCRIIPHLDISDIITLSFHDSPLIETVIFGDQFQTAFPAMGVPMNTLARDISMKVVGKSDDLQKAETVLELEEVLS